MTIGDFEVPTDSAAPGKMAGMEKAFSAFKVRAVDEDQRIIRGIATSPRIDRASDSIDPLGVTFADSVPLLVAHSHDRPVGRVKFEKPTAEGVRFEARLPKVDDPGPFKDRVDTAWLEVKSGTVTDVSIGFRPLDGEVEALPNGGIRYKRIELMELSLVPVPANPDARILEVRSHTGIGRKPKLFVGSAQRRKNSGGIVADEGRYLRRTRAALVSWFGEKNVPRFRTLADLDKWDDARVLKEHRGIVLTHEEITKATPRRASCPVVKL